MATTFLPQSRKGIGKYRPLRPIFGNFRTDSKYITDRIDIFTAEEAIYDSDSYSALTVCEVRNRFLVVAFPAEHRDLLLPEVAAIGDELASHFREGMATWSPYLNRIRRLVGKPDYDAIVRIVGGIIGEAGKRLREP